MNDSGEQTSRRVAEHAREDEWKSHAFLRDLFLGTLRLDLVHPYPDPPRGNPKFEAFYSRLMRFLREEVDPVAIDEFGGYPPAVIEGLTELGAFGMAIPERYGGLGFTHREYAQAMMLVGSHDANVAALLSAHQSIGVPRPILLFGTERQKMRFLPRCARGAISAFALTEPGVGSDPARIETTAAPTPDGRSFVIDGTKLWCTNGTIAELLVVVARTPGTDRISAFVVDTKSAGVTVTHRCRFMGLKALANAELRFHGVVVPRENLIGEEGQGLKIALVTLNSGRIALPAATTGAAKLALEVCRKWSRAREQWGQPIGRHEAIAHKLADMASTTFTMEAVADLTAAMADREGYDIRLEAAAAKEWNTVRGWQITDDALEIRGGRGYESERSLAARGEFPVGIERMMRDSRVNRIFEGSSEIMHLFMAREAVDRHLRVAGVLIDRDKSFGAKVAALPRIFAFYIGWLASMLVGWVHWNRYSDFGDLAPHMRFVERSSRKLARSARAQASVPLPGRRRRHRALRHDGGDVPRSARAGCGRWRAARGGLGARRSRLPQRSSARGRPLRCAMEKRRSRAPRGGRTRARRSRRLAGARRDRPGRDRRRAPASHARRSLHAQGVGAAPACAAQHRDPVAATFLVHRYQAVVQGELIDAERTVRRLQRVAHAAAHELDAPVAVGEGSPGPDVSADLLTRAARAGHALDDRRGRPGGGGLHARDSGARLAACDADGVGSSARRRRRRDLIRVLAGHQQAEGRGCQKAHPHPS
jgi:hypothetical protein